MTYRRRGYRAGSRPASTFRRDARYEVSKEGLGKFAEKLGEWGGAALGLAAGAAAARFGLPLPASVSEGVGMALGAAAGATAKGTLVAAFDNLKRLREDRRTRRQATGAPGSTPRGIQRGLRGIHGDPDPGRSRRSSQSVSVGAVIGEVERVIGELDRAERELLELIDRVRSTQGWILLLLSGGRPDVLSEVNGRTGAVGRALSEACTLLRLGKDDLRSYLRGI